MKTMKDDSIGLRSYEEAVILRCQDNRHYTNSYTNCDNCFSVTAIVKLKQRNKSTCLMVRKEAIRSQDYASRLCFRIYYIFLTLNLTAKPYKWASTFKNGSAPPRPCRISYTKNVMAGSNPCNNVM